MTDKNIKPFVLFIDSGFKYNIANHYQRKCELVSENFQGKIVTFGDAGDYKFGDIDAKVFKVVLPPNMVFSLLLPFCKLYMALRTLIYSIYLAKKGTVDLIVTYDPLTTGLMGVLVSKLVGVPLIVEVNGDYTAWSIYSHIKNPLLRKLKRWSKVWIQRFVFKRASGIKTLYKDQLSFFSDIVSSKVVRQYPNYLNVKGFYNGGEKKTVSIIGFPFVIKGIDIAIDGFKKISDQHPDWSLEILGFFPDNEPQLIEKYIDGHPRISHLGPIDRADMPEYIGNTGIVLCASRTEGFPRVIKEAMQAGKPCIASNVGGLGAAIDNKTNGLLFESENIEQLASCLNMLISNKSLRSEFGNEALKFAKKEYSDEAFIFYVTEFYNSILNGEAIIDT